MGVIIEKRCPECGYSKIFYEGTGLNGMNLNIINNIFTPDELTEFLDMLKIGVINYYQMSEQVGYCEKCNTLENACVLEYTDNTGAEHKIQKQCQSCNGLLDFSEKTNMCPNCFTILNRTETGHWD